jgi:hypothetical protein
MNNLKHIVLRILAVFASNALGVIGAGAIAGIPLWKACFVAGIGGVATVVERLARAYMDDGKLSVAEIDGAFSQARQEVEAKAEEASATKKEKSATA